MMSLTKRNETKRNKAMPPKKPPVGKEGEERLALGKKKTTRLSTKCRDRKIKRRRIFDCQQKAPPEFLMVVAIDKQQQQQ